MPRIGDVRVDAGRCSSPPSSALARARVRARAGAPRRGAVDPGLRDGSRGSTSRRHWARDGLVVAQTALALVLLTGSALAVPQLPEASGVDPGYDTRDIFTFQIAPEQHGPSMDRSFARFHLAFMDRLAQLPGVESVGIVDNVPLNESPATGSFRPRGRARRRRAHLGLTSVAGDYFSTMGIRLLAGRPFTEGTPLSTLGT